ncbi:uroporphyrinogen-III C-methyltransferase [Methylibium sp.]|uniref:uroporphyrinogen-III C-methyltransferase n=1 Tax=Methylibium sp. TaxID=2067992 RepID=UPI0025F6A6C4|nr:uroporphyrinogen-III C-methyltransferase [Methylibium sp.]
MAPRRSRRWWLAGGLLLALLALAALALAWRTQERVQTLEQELVRRQTASAGQATEAHLMAKQARESAQEAGAKVALLEERVAESTMQRSQLEGLIQSMARSGQESLLVDIEGGIRVAVQQTAITGSAEPLVAALTAADERLARTEQPRFENVRRAIARDLDRIRSVGVADIASLAIKLDEAVRLVDDAPLRVIDAPATAATRAALLADAPVSATPSAASAPAPVASAPPAAPSVPPAAASASPAAGSENMWAWLPANAGDWWRSVWQEARGLVRVTRIDRPEAMLLAPEQSFFLRENLKLRILNARVALQSRQFDTARADLQEAASATERYFDADARKTLLLSELLRSVAAQAGEADLPRPDETLTALDAAAQGR